MPRARRPRGASCTRTPSASTRWRHEAEGSVRADSSPGWVCSDREMLGYVRLALARVNPGTIAFSATLLCVWLSAEGALRLPRKTPRLFMATALFALNWAILLLYYLPGPPQDELLSTFSGFLLVYVGVLLIREARSRRPGDHAG